MKKAILILVFLIAIQGRIFAQTKVTRYCMVVTSISGFSGKNFKVEFVPGQKDSLIAFKDTSERIRLQKVNKMPTNTDVLNYMSAIGWSLVAIANTPYFSITHYYFKKEFNTEELAYSK